MTTSYHNSTCYYIRYTTLINACFIRYASRRRSKRETRPIITVVRVEKNLCKFCGRYLQITAADVGYSVPGFYNNARRGREKKYTEKRPSARARYNNIGRYLRETRACKIISRQLLYTGLFYIIFCRARKYGVH